MLYCIYTYRQGFVVSASLEAALASVNAAFIPAPPSVLPNSEGTNNAFTRSFLPLGSKLRQGTRLVKRAYAALLEKAAEYGPKGEPNESR